MRRANEIRYCVGGRWAGNAETVDPCVIFYQHREECENLRTEARVLVSYAGATEADLTPEQAKAHHCRGCLPREAVSGWLCEHCHRHLAQWLANGETNSLLFAWRWLRTQYAPVQSSAGRQDWERSGSRDDLPSALREAVLDCRRLMEDRVYIAEERAWQTLTPEQPMADLPPFDLVEGVAFLRNHMLGIEDHRDLVGPLFVRVQDSMVDAHRLAPWRATATKIRGEDGPIPCPHCERKTLSIFGGDAFVTCRSCHSTIHDGRFGIWTEMLEGERREGA